jgi:hypothetical protein
MAASPRIAQGDIWLRSEEILTGSPIASSIEVLDRLIAWCLACLIFILAIRIVVWFIWTTLGAAAIDLAVTVPAPLAAAPAGHVAAAEHSPYCCATLGTSFNVQFSQELRQFRIEVASPFGARRTRMSQLLAGTANLDRTLWARDRLRS